MIKFGYINILIATVVAFILVRVRLRRSTMAILTECGI